ncbi:transglycosylase SLT domain-containing protein [Streptomyces sp. TRM 70361]|uniref:transglycosylase SLT domain-containing protein n=1 Tax=Streptomyces sp. TRM 70361 TaxID=3116553 RepID=UPI002E7B54C9|nr:transglycosylase SLT domain-containing protein [Streptomyces sp. TRM 70361]MEE1940980.1 transglycosylase SLT domain-containing protein [Streptomyces sp. TRM 70361]
MSGTAEEEQSSAEKGRNLALIGAGIGLGSMGGGLLLITLLLIGVFVVCAIGFILWPLVIICDIFGCGDGDGSAQVNSDQVVEAFQGDGGGELYYDSLPSKYHQPIQDAGAECTQIGPVVIAAQIQQESAFNESLVGPDGAEGISQVPPDKFEEFGEDEDDNDETSALDFEDSIGAQGKYMCSLAEEIDTLIANNEVEGDRLDMTLAAYDLGLDAVKQAKGVPDGSRAQSYIIGVRTSFALYSGAIAPPSGSPYPTITPLPLPEQ